MANPRQQLEAILEGQLGKRGLPRAPGGALAFTHETDTVRVTLGESVYRGLIVTVHDTPRPRQFRAIDGTFDFDAIADAIVDVAKRRRADRTGPAKAVPPRAQVPFSIQPGAAPGRMRVNVSDMELDPVSAMQLYALLRHAGAVA
jgi:hypothetical protein